MSNMFTFVNLTPHAITETISGREFAPSGEIARVASETVPAGGVDDVPFCKVKFGFIEGLPEPEENKIFIVSGMVLDRVHGRTDVVAPGELVRDEDGRPVGCKGFRLKSDE